MNATQIKLSLSCLLVASIFCNLVAQPEQDAFIPCHHAQQHLLYRHKPSELDIQLMENSNRRSDSIDIINYTIDIDITNYSGKSIKANTKVSFVPKQELIEWIQLDLKTLTVDSIYFEGQAIAYNHDGEIITAFFGKSLQAGVEHALTVFYQGIPVRDPVWGGFYFADDYIYNLGIGLSTTPPNFGKVWFPCFDNFVERATFDYHVTTTADKKAFCVGELVSEAMPSPNRIKRHFKMERPITTYLSSIAAANYAVSRAIHPAASGDIPVDLIAKPGDLNQMIIQFEKIGLAIDAFEYWFGRYRFSRVGYVATTVGAMEHPTNVAYPISTVQGGTLLQNERLYGHELGHHWWGDITTLDDARDMWIKEGTAEYSSHLFMEWAYGKSEFRDAVKSNLSNILFNAHKNDGGMFLPLSPMPYEHTYGTHTYRKGAAMIHNLRGYVGDDEFRRLSTMVFDSMDGKSMNAYQFRDFLNRHSSRDLTAYFDDYIFNPGYCTFYIDTVGVSRVNNMDYLDLGIQQKAYHAAHLYREVPMEVSVYNDKLERFVFTVELSGPYQQVHKELPVGFKPAMVILNELQNLNHASLQSQGIIKKTGAATIPYTSMVVNVSNVTDSSFVNVAHHLVGPDADRKAANIDRISSTHFWQVAAIQHGALTMDGRVEYNGLDSNSIDKDILFTSEDSLLLVYRKDKSEEWRDYPDYTKLIVNPSDRKGFVRISKLIPGDYALAHGYKATVGTKDIEKYHVQLYPNPVKDILNIPTQEFNTNFKFEIIDIRGQKVNSGTGESSIDVSQLAPGHYELLIKNQQSPNWKQARFVKQ